MLTTEGTTIFDLIDIETRCFLCPPINKIFETMFGIWTATTACSNPKKIDMTGTATSGSPVPVTPLTKAPTPRPITTIRSSKRSSGILIVSKI